MGNQQILFSDFVWNLKKGEYLGPKKFIDKEPWLEY